MYRKLLPWYIDQDKHTLVIKKVQKRFLDKDSIRLLNWNVHKNNHSYRWLQDFRHILQNFSPNFISFQEYQTVSKKSVLENHKEYGYGFFPNIEMQSKKYGLINASTCEIYYSNQAVSEHVEPLIKVPKISLLTQYDITKDEKLTLINTHMINFVYKKKYLSQLGQLETLCANHDKIILTGDFNTWNAKRMYNLQSLVKTLDLKQVDFKFSQHKKRYLPYPLDHVFYKGLILDSSQILQNIKSSDHKPIIVNFLQDI